MLERPEEYETMAQVEWAHWWYKALRQRVHAALKRWAPRDGRLLDAGCGTGGNLRALKDLGWTQLEGFDLSEEAVQRAQQWGFDVRQGALHDVPQLYAGQSFSALTCNDVLYFYRPDQWVSVTEGFAQVLEPGAVVVMNLPALSSFSGTHDLSVGIARRFSKADLPQVYSEETFELLQAQYWPFLLSPVIYGVRRAQRATLAQRTPEDIKSDLEMPSSGINKILFALTELDRRLFPWAPWGSSLFLVLRRR